MDRESTAYLIVHYLILVALVLLAVALIEGFFPGVPLWAGLLIAIGIGFAYPRVAVATGYAPARWEGRRKEE